MDGEMEGWMNEGWMDGYRDRYPTGGLPDGPRGKKKKKHPPAKARDSRDGSSTPGWEDPLEEDKAAHSSILAWRIPWTEKPGGLQSMGSQRVRHN